MSDIVTLTNKRCQASYREDEMKDQTTGTLAPFMQCCRKDRSADVLPKHKQSAMAFGI
jgi:hypothetical protein